VYGSLTAFNPRQLKVPKRGWAPYKGPGSCKIFFFFFTGGGVNIGAKKKMTQHFRGYLAGLSVLSNRTEDDRVISCLNQCQEKLDFSPVDTLDDTVNHSAWLLKLRQIGLLMICGQLLRHALRLPCIHCIAGPKAWNQLLAHLRALETVGPFKTLQRGIKDLSSLHPVTIPNCLTRHALVMTLFVLRHVRNCRRYYYYYYC